MVSDQRLRLIAGTEGSGTGVEVLRALDEVRVVIRTGLDMTGAHTGALAAFVGMAARLFGDVVLEPPVVLAPNWWGADDTTALLSTLEHLRPRPSEPPSHDFVVTFGDQVNGGRLGIGGDDYTVRLGLDAQALGPAPTHAFGVHASACLAISQILGVALAHFGYSGVELDRPYVMNLVDYTLIARPANATDTVAPTTPLRVAVAGVGSVGTSTLALLATAFASRLAPATATPPSADLVSLELIDDDTIDPDRNPFRYPALSGMESGAKAVHVADRLNSLGLRAAGHACPVAESVRSRAEPGFDGLLISSVDTLDGRLDVTDVLSRATLSVGVSGLALHAQREGFADGFACPFCDYVSAEPPQTQAGSHSHMTGLPLPRVLALMQQGARLSDADVDTAIAAGRIASERRGRLVGAPLSDLVRQAYAEVELRVPDHSSGDREVLALAAPQVSWFAGVLAAVEVVKQVRGLPLLDRRVDVDMGGIPPGLVRRPPADATGRCLCRSGTRIRWYRALYGSNGTEVPSPPAGGANDIPTPRSLRLPAAGR